MDLENTLRQAIPTGKPEALWAAVVNFRDAGGTRKDAYDIVLKLIAEHQDDKDEMVCDNLRDLGDGICGWCAPSVAIWPSDGFPMP